MAKSPEYPDLQYVAPRSYTLGRPHPVQLIVIHTTEGSAHAGSAEDGAEYDVRRTDGTSAHYYVDSDSIVQCVQTSNIAHTAMPQGNRRGIHYELCGKAGWTADVWAGEYAIAMLRRAAKQAARDARKWGIPIRHATIGQMRVGEKGFCGHDDVRLAWNQTTHTDPGKNFPWQLFIAMVSKAYEEMYAPKPAEDDMPTAAQVVDEIEKRLADPESALYKRMRAIAWQYPADTDDTPRSALGVFADAAEDAESNSQRLARLENAAAGMTEKLNQIVAVLNPPPTQQLSPGSLWKNFASEQPK